jgi:hypothetical protein
LKFDLRMKIQESRTIPSVSSTAITTPPVSKKSRSRDLHF